ncbi:uncharacterized protein LY89DRAFT_735014 [Mollisia scopiformis]|uniref:Uncharacterized protein n=1 Tax=Mollisia scopiformis TaxID=149040 RepID=A0A194X6R8_MOLSC|nr:uncharacterized protein LY89DRAFT_735014 [Mollisia scopiformis]KUJ15868.1 hypothetical protein LY89DRAFT_735014 [Mollisia scopiformis]
MAIPLYGDENPQHDEAAQLALIGLGVMCLTTLMIQAVINLWPESQPQSAPAPALDSTSSSSSSTSPATPAPSTPPKANQPDTTLFLAMLGYFALCGSVGGMTVWILQLGIVDGKRRNSILMYAIGGINVLLAYLVLTKEKRGTVYMLGALWAPLIGIVGGSLIV